MYSPDLSKKGLIQWKLVQTQTFSIERVKKAGPNLYVSSERPPALYESGILKRLQETSLGINLSGLLLKTLPNLSPIPKSYRLY